MVSIIALFMGSCTNDSYTKLYPASANTTCDTTAVSYATTIMPIIAANCNASNCHDGSNRAATNYLTYAGVKLNAPLIVNYLTGTSGDPMPKNLPPLSSCNIAKISAWINQGALNN